MNSVDYRQNIHKTVIKYSNRENICKVNKIYLTVVNSSERENCRCKYQTKYSLHNLSVVNLLIGKIAVNRPNIHNF